MNLTDKFIFGDYFILLKIDKEYSKHYCAIYQNKAYFILFYIGIFDFVIHLYLMKKRDQNDPFELVSEANFIFD